MKTSGRRVGCMVAATILFGACWRASGPLIVSLRGLDGVVVDANSEVPVGGAHIIAAWYARPAFAIEPSSGEVTHVAEAIADGNGHFTIRPPGRFLRPPWRMYVGDDWEFQIYAYKPGYSFRARWLNQAVVWPVANEERLTVLSEALRFPRDRWNVPLARFPSYQKFVIAQSSGLPVEDRSRIDRELSPSHFR